MANMLLMAFSTHFSTQYVFFMKTPRKIIPYDKGQAVFEMMAWLALGFRMYYHLYEL